MAAPATVYGELALKTTTGTFVLGRLNASFDPKPVDLPHSVETQSHRVR